MSDDKELTDVLKQHVTGEKPAKKTTKATKKVENVDATKNSTDEVETKEPREGNFKVEYTTNVTKYGTKEPGDLSRINQIDDVNADFSEKEISDLLVINLPSKNDVRPEDIELDENEDNLSQKDVDWSVRIADSSMYNAISSDSGTKNLYKETLERDTEWGQYYENKNKDKLGITTAGFDLSSTGPMRGAKAVSQVKAMLGLGNMVRVPLWHSGFWVTLNTPSEAEVVDLYRILSSDKITIGRQTHGLAFSNLSGIITETLVDFVLAHVELHSIQVPSDKDTKNFLKSMILVQDTPLLIWGIASTMFPRGFEYTRQCISTDSCKGTIQEMLDVRRLLFVDRTSLNNDQLAHMTKAKSPVSVTVDEVKKYQDSISRLQHSETKVLEGIQNRKGNCDMYITLSSPSISRYIESTNKWVDQIEKMANEASGLNTDSEKEAYMEGQVRATKARQYVHWIKSIKYINRLDGSDEEFESFVNDFNDIEELASSVFSLDTNIVDRITKEVTNYISYSTIALIGIPTYDCPVCKKTQNVPNRLPRFTNFIPLDVTMLFFRLLVRRNAFLRFR